MPIPTPQKNEKQSEFMTRCMHEAATNPNRSNEQNVAICLDAWREEHPGSSPPPKNRCTSYALASFEDPKSGALLWKMFVRPATAKAQDPDRKKDAEEAGETESDDSANGLQGQSPQKDEMDDQLDDDQLDDQLDNGGDNGDDEKDDDETSDEDSGLEIVDMLVYGDIGMSSDEADAEDMGVSSRVFAQALAQVPDAKRINLHINSAGGNVYDAIAIQNKLADHPAQVVAYVDGLAASAASVLAVGADKTIMRQNSFMMIHNSWAAAIGDKETMLKAAEQLGKADDTVAGIYAEKSELPKDKVMALMQGETWMTAREAQKMGFADQVRGKTTKARKTSAKAFVFNSVSFDLSRFRKLPSALNRMKLFQQEKAAPDLVSANAVILEDSIMTIDDLKTKNPELYQQVYALGQSEGVKCEQTRIAQLDALLTPETQAIVTKAKLEGRQAVDVMAECFREVVNAKNKITVSSRARDAGALNIIGSDISDTHKIELTVQEKRAEAAALIAMVQPGRNGALASKTLK